MCVDVMYYSYGVNGKPQMKNMKTYVATEQGYWI